MNDSPVYVILDLESTDIVELSAVTLETDKSGLPRLFDAYLKPSKDLTSEATSVNGLVLQRDSGRLRRRNEELFTETPEVVLRDFLAWLIQLKQPGRTFGAVLPPLQPRHWGIHGSTLAIARHPTLANLRKKTLFDVCRAMDIHVQQDELHSGIYDSVLLRVLVEKLLKEAGSPSFLETAL
ncbi:Hypothetical protein FKW44_000011 [Caligus rogercresseyi]|uniref:Exonuclease domain-containing protein n=1 Tax=Caligus rogercresseyi TaxID=217165 RepID=A0A7T8KGT6_CALRO|nr:Hypothetical protein FKW44_000011 [Caligus rogercresseyi]